MRDQRPALMIVTGFLGSGKTSFLQHFLEYQAGKNCFVAVIQNEIGEIGLDRMLLDQNYKVAENDARGYQSRAVLRCGTAGNAKNKILALNTLLIAV